MMVQPTGTVTLVFTDVEGSTRLLNELGQDAYRQAFAEHRRARPRRVQPTRRLRSRQPGRRFLLRVRVGAGGAPRGRRGHAGARGRADPDARWRPHRRAGLDPPKYVGVDVHRAARIMSAAHGGQVVVSQSTHDLAGDGLRDLGEHLLKDFPERQRLWQLGAGDFPPLRTIENRQTNLPATAWPLLGREREVGELVELLSNGARVVTITGAGRHGQDAARDRRRPRARRRGRGRRVLGAARRAARGRPRPPGDHAGRGGGGRPGRASARPAGPARARQLRARSRRPAAGERAAGAGARRQAPDDEPRGAPPHGRARVCARAARAPERHDPVRRACAGGREGARGGCDG